jgi:hypothetical protein
LQNPDFVINILRFRFAFADTCGDLTFWWSFTKAANFGLEIWSGTGIIANHVNKRKNNREED